MYDIPILPSRAKAGESSPTIAPSTVPTRPRYPRTSTSFPQTRLALMISGMADDFDETKAQSRISGR
jgi:hypothetical protein